MDDDVCRLAESRGQPLELWLLINTLDARVSELNTFAGTQSFFMLLFRAIGQLAQPL